MSEAMEKRCDVLKGLNAVNVKLFKQYLECFFLDKTKNKPHIHRFCISLKELNKPGHLLYLSLVPVDINTLDFSFMPFTDGHFTPVYINLEKYITALVPEAFNAEYEQLNNILKKANSILTESMDMFRRNQEFISLAYTLTSNIKASPYAYSSNKEVINMSFCPELCDIEHFKQVITASIPYKEKSLYIHRIVKKYQEIDTTLN